MRFHLRVAAAPLLVFGLVFSASAASWWLAPGAALPLGALAGLAAAAFAFAQARRIASVAAALADPGHDLAAMETRGGILADIAAFARARVAEVHETYRRDTALAAGLALYRAVPDALVSLGRDGQAVAANRRGRELLDALPKGAARAPDAMTGLAARTNAEGIAVQDALPLGERLYRAVAVPVPDPDGGTTCLLHLCDVTESARDAARWRALEAGPPVGEFDRQGRLVCANPAMLAMGARPGRTADELFPEGAAEAGAWARMTADRWAPAHLAAKPADRGAGTGGVLIALGSAGPEISGAVFVGGVPVGQAEPAMADALSSRAVVEAHDDVVRRLVQALGADCTVQIDKPFASALEPLREAYNGFVERHAWALGSAGTALRQISGEAACADERSRELMRHGQRQQAMIAAAAETLTDLGSQIARSSADSRDAREFVGKVRRSADDSGGVVTDAVAAMGEIEGSSERIAQIIGVIEDIAFQTNLLALNAGVEAARAGEFGRGFAVVATEVRALAQRSSDAAKEIKALIAESECHVAKGVDLVKRAGTALREITGEVASIERMVSGIAVSSDRQSDCVGLIEKALDDLSGLSVECQDILSAATSATNSISRELEQMSQGLATYKTAPARRDAGAIKGEADAGTPRTDALRAQVPAQRGAMRRTALRRIEAVGNDMPAAAITAEAQRADHAARADLDGGWEDF